ncbi:trypsin-like serine peptidase [Porphyromonas sp.]
MWAQEQCGGQPRGIGSVVATRAKVNLTHLNRQDTEARLSWKNRQDGIFYIGQTIPLDKEASFWQYNSDLSIWQLEISAPGAKALSLYYSSFEIPQGARLFLYTPTGSEILGAYTELSAPKRSGAHFATEMLMGDRVILEYQPSPCGEAPKVEVESLGYIVRLPRGRGLRADGYDYAGEDNSGSCMVNINCEEGAAWQKEKKSIAFIQTKVGNDIAVCTGTLLNNSKQDGTPYLITAAHCAIPGEGRQASAEDLEQWVFYFHYEKEQCGNESAASLHAVSLVGAEQLAVSSLKGGTDGLFLRLKEAIPPSYDLYFSGWSRSSALASSGVGIHHPSGDATKISTYTTTPRVDRWDESSQKDAHLNVTYTATKHGHGVTEKGSSGSGLFDAEHHLVGTLTGGTAACSAPEGTNYYGRLAAHFGSMGLAQWLAPGNSDLLSLGGHYPLGDRARVRDFVVWQGQLGMHASWVAPDGDLASLQGYVLYVDNQKALTIPKDRQTAVLNYEQEGTHYISITALYTDGESRPVGTHFSSQGRHILVPIDALAEGKVHWKKPQLRQVWSYNARITPEELIKVGDIETASFFYVGVRYGADQLRNAVMHGKYITALRFVPISAKAIPYLYIKQGDRTHVQRVVLPEQLGQVQEVALTTPFELKETEPLFVGLRFRGDTKDPFVAMTSEPRLLGRSMLASLNGENFFEYKTLTHSLALETLVSDAPLSGQVVELYRGESPSLFPHIIGYNMLCDGRSLGQIEEKGEGQYSFDLPPECQDETKLKIEAILSDEKPSFTQPLVNDSPTPRLCVGAGGHPYLLDSRAVERVLFYDLSGQLLGDLSPQQLGQITLSPGQYLVQIVLVGGSIGSQKLHVHSI